MKKLVLSVFFLLAGCGPSIPQQDNAEKAFFKKYNAILKSDDPKLRLLGPSVMPRISINKFGARVMYQEEMPIDEARGFFIALVRQFVDRVNVSRDLKEQLSPYPLTIPRVEFTLSFWTDDMERPAKPYVAEIRLKDGEITYFYKKEESEALDAAVRQEKFPDS